MLSRRQLLLAAGAAGATALAGRPGPLRAEAVLTEDGLYTQPWFLQSFLDLADDLQGAAAKAKRFAVMWELKGCPYCKETHLVNFADPAIEAYVRDNFDILQLNIIGSRPVTDFDGQALPEKALAQKYNVRFTPTFQFFPESADGLAAKPAETREVARLPGYLKPEHFLAMFRFVRDKVYERMSFRDFLKGERG
jgi:thioredoxin-related protein